MDESQLSITLCDKGFRNRPLKISICFVEVAEKGKFYVLVIIRKLKENKWIGTDIIYGIAL